MATTTPKPVHSLVLDTGPLIKNDPSVSSLIAQAEILYTIPSVIDEIRDAATRSRLETTLKPFLTIRSPTAASIKVITDFARKTGDLAVLSRPDLHVIALAYELECERNHGDWRLRSVPGQKRLNGAPPSNDTEKAQEGTEQPTEDVTPAVNVTPGPVPESRGAWGTAIPATIVPEVTEAEPSSEATVEKKEDAVPEHSSNEMTPSKEVLTVTREDENVPTEAEAGISGGIVTQETQNAVPVEAEPDTIEEVLEDTHLSEIKTDQDLETTAESTDAAKPLVENADITQDASVEEVQGSRSGSEDSDGGEWITPSNLKKHQEKDSNTSMDPEEKSKTMQVATITSDYAMQNVLLRMNLNLLSPKLMRVRELKTWVLRCHACFYISKDMTKQFCARCGGATLMRTSCSTDKNGVFKVHLKKNMQYNTRGNVYSIPKPVAGTSNGKLVSGGGKGGWGQGLILAEDQKEYVQAMTGARRKKEKDLMDEDYLPSILSGDRHGGGGKPKVGAGRNVNSKKRR